MSIDPGITDIARQLADSIPTGATTSEQTIQDWRSTIYNAKATASITPLVDLIERSASAGDETPRRMAEALRRKR